MPYALSLQSYLPPGVFVEPPVEWERRLREISPVTERLAHLRFRYFPPNPPRDDGAWGHPAYREPNARGIWGLYSCTPKHLVARDRAEQFAQHWSELPPELQQGRKSVVSSYQHFMWHAYGVEARPFWLLQGDGGGTPAVYTRVEERSLDAIGAPSEPFPVGFFPPCPFDERAVHAIAARDRFFRVSQRLDELEKLDRPAHLKAEDELAEQEFRRKWLGWWHEQVGPNADFLKHYLRKSEADRTLPEAPEGLADAVSQWEDHWVQHGSVIGAGVARSKKLQVAVK